MPATNRPSPLVFFVLVAGVAGGWFLARLSGDSRSSPTTNAGEVRLREHPAEGTDGAPSTPGRTPVAPPPRESIATEEPASSREPGSSGVPGEDEARSRARREIGRGWLEVRGEEIPALTLADGVNRFDRIVRDSPAEIGRELAGRQDELDQAATHGGAFTLLERMLHGIAGAEGGELAADGAALAELFESTSVGETRDGRLFLDDLDAGIEDGTTLTFPAGVFRLDSLEKEPFPRDVTIRGAGMDRTLLFISDLSVRTPLVSFAIRDCTVNTENDALMDLRREPCSMFFENVRFIGFDSGAGGSCLLETPAGVFLARGCRFESGYGRAPQHASLMDIRSDGLVARFERCRFERVEIEEHSIRPGARVVFDSCTLTDLLDRRPLVESERLRLPGTTVTYHDWDEAGDPPQLDLEDVFPGWKDQLGD